MVEPDASGPSRPHPVHWSEGMFLRPQHLQSAERHARYQLKASEDWYHPFNWGVRSIDLDREALRDYRVELLACDVRFEDGTKFSIPADGVPDPVRLRDEMLEQNDATIISLGVPRYREQ